MSLFPKEKTLTILEVIERIMTPSQESLKTLLNFAFSFIKADWLKQAMDQWIDPVPVFEAWMDGLDNNFIFKSLSSRFHVSGRSTAKRIMALWWRGYLDDTLSDANKVKEYLDQDPKIKKLLETERGKKYLNYMVKRLYDWAYYFVWETPD